MLINNLYDEIICLSMAELELNRRTIEEPDYSAWGSIGSFTMRTLTERIESRVIDSAPGGVDIGELIGDSNPTKAANIATALLVLTVQGKITVDLKCPDQVRLASSDKDA